MSVEAGADATALARRTIVEEGDPRRWFALPVLLIGAFLPILDFNVVNLALPAIRQNLFTASRRCASTSSNFSFIPTPKGAT